MPFDYDSWLESPYTGGWECSNDECPVCNEECQDCDGSGNSKDQADEDCQRCDGEGTIYVGASKSDHDEFYEPDERDDD